MTTVHQVLVRHFHAFQTDSNELNSRDHVRLVQNDLKDVDLCAELEALSVAPTTTGTSSSASSSASATGANSRNRLHLHQQVSAALLQCLHCLLVSETTPPVDDSDSLLDSMAALAVEYNVLEDTFLALIHPASVAATDRIRLVACRMITACMKQLAQTAMTPPHDDLLIQHQQLISLLLPRFTDKAQSVRLAALQGAQACCDFAAAAAATATATTQSEVPQELTDAVLWNLHHDPSWTNRCQALQSLSLTLHTNQSIHHVIRRLRDVKPKVRVAALERLRAVPIDKLTPDQCAEVVRAGFTDRYVHMHTAYLLPEQAGC